MTEADAVDLIHGIDHHDDNEVVVVWDGVLIVRSPGEDRPGSV